MLKTILVVDDDEVIVKLITKSLRYEQFAILSAYSGKAFDHALKNQKVIRSLSCKNLQNFDDEVDGWEFYRFVHSRLTMYTS
ncbi:hypothetical protein D3C81_580520 [compost metagenome]